MRTKTAYGLKSEKTSDGIVWHLMKGHRPDSPNMTFATWTTRLGTYTDHSEASAALREIEGRPRTITLDWPTPPRRLRLKWWLADQWLRLLFALHVKRHLTADEWYAAGCPPYPGQKRWVQP